MSESLVTSLAGLSRTRICLVWLAPLVLGCSQPENVSTSKDVLQTADPSGAHSDSTVLDGATLPDADSTSDSSTVGDVSDTALEDSDDLADGDSDAVDGCKDGWFHYVDKMCHLTKPGTPPIPCQEKGDGKCYLVCTADADCGSTGFKCITLGLFNGGGHVCNKKVEVCGPQEIHKGCF